MSDCIFCQIVQGELHTDFIFEDADLVAFQDINPRADTHLLLVPKQHIQDITVLQNHQHPLLLHMFKMLPIIATAAGLTNGFRTVINTGPGGGQTVFHLHMHILGGPNLPAL